MSEQKVDPAYRIHTPRLVIRCWEPADALLLKAAIDASLDHLRPWMPWTQQEPEPLKAKVARLRQFRADFDLDRNYVYGIFDRDETEVLGGTGLHARVDPGGIEIGYWIHAEHINQGLATETAGALTRVAIEVHGLDRVEIHCDPANLASAAVPRKLGFSHEVTLRRRVLISEGTLRDSMIWTLFAADYLASPAAKVPVEAFDVVGNQLL